MMVVIVSSIWHSLIILISVLRYRLILWVKSSNIALSLKILILLEKFSLGKGNSTVSVVVLVFAVYL